MKLFVKRVFISDNFEEQLLPRWLSFLKGMVDSEDLPLNVSRELLQKSRVLSIISKRLVRKSLDMFQEIAKDKEKFATFTTNFGRYIKVGVIEDRDNKDALLKIASFTTSSGARTTAPRAAATAAPPLAVCVATRTASASTAQHPRGRVRSRGNEHSAGLRVTDERGAEADLLPLGRLQGRCRRVARARASQQAGL
jgi:HSP90 family molecular chaperone